MVAVLGAGSWGTTLAAVVADKGEKVWLWARNDNLVRYMAAERRNPQYIPQLSLPPTLHVTSDLDEALSGQDVVVHAVPSHATREFAATYAPYLAEDAVVVSATKGLEEGSHKRMTTVLHEETGRQAGLVTGPNHAEEVALGQPTAAVTAHPTPRVARRLAETLTSARFKVYPRTDLVGSELCGAYKNVVALAAGMSAGLGWGDNAQAALVTLGVDEMVALVRRLGGAERTCYGLAGVGDLVATCTSAHSRNRRVGVELARGRSLDEVMAAMRGMVAEGVKATKAFHEFADDEGLELPLTRVVHAIVYEGLTVQEGVEELLARV